MKWRYTIAAGILFAALLAWVLTQENTRVPGEGEVFGIDSEQVTSLRIERVGHEPLVIERQDEGWFITAPWQSMADADEVERMVKAIAELRTRSSRDGVDTSREEFGLSKPEIVATITLRNGDTATVALGAETPLGGERYAKLSGDHIRIPADLHIVPAFLRTTLEKDPETLREKKLVAMEPDEVQRITLQHGEETIVATRAPEGAEVSWRLEQPIQTDADEWSTKQVLNDIRDMKVEEFVDPDADVDPGFDSPQAVVTLALADGEQITITFGKTESRKIGDAEAEKEIVYAKTSQRSEIMMLEADALEDVQKTVFDLRDKSVLRVSRNDVQRIRVERSKGLSFVVARRQDGWRVEQPKNVDAERTVIDDILWDLEDLAATAFVEESPSPQKLREYGLAVPQTVITIEVKGRSEPIKVLIGDETEDGDYYAMTSESDQVVTISEFLMGDLPETIDDLEATEEPQSETDEPLAGAPDEPAELPDE